MFVTYTQGTGDVNVIWVSLTGPANLACEKMSFRRFGID